jgi:hypothetical protein
MAEDPVQAEELPDHLRYRIAELGLEVQLRHLGTPEQLAFAVPVRGLGYWQARLIRDRKLVTHGEGVTPEAAVDDALRALDRDVKRHRSHASGDAPSDDHPRVKPLPPRLGLPIALFTFAGLIVGAVSGAVIAGASFLPLFLAGLLGYLCCWLLVFAWYRRQPTG